MIKLINICLLGILIFGSSCLKSGLDDLPVYDNTEISNVKFEYRWWDEKINQMRVVEIKTDKRIENSAISCKLTVPAATSTFTEEIRSKVLLSNIIGVMDISAGANVAPLDNAPKLGVPGDFSNKDFSYLVTAADGITKSEWNLIIESFSK